MWIHPVDRNDAPAEIKLLGQAWQAIMAASGGWQEADRDAPQWAEDVLAAFEAQHPGFNRAECMTPAWLEEKKAAYAAYYASKEAEKKARAATVQAAVDACDLDTLVHLKVEKVEVKSKIMRNELMVLGALVWGRGDKAIGIRGGKK